MADPEGVRLDLRQVLELFPDQNSLVRRLVVVDETFRSICEDYALAKATLATLEAGKPTDQQAAELADYRVLIADLERELGEALKNAT